MNWLTIKAKLIALGAGLLTILAFLARFKMVKAQRDKARVRADTAEAKAHHARTVAKADNVIELQERSRRADALNEIKDKGASDLLSKPNDKEHWNDNDS